MADWAIFVTIVTSFAVLVTAHLSLAVGLLVRPPHWRGPVGLLVLPLAPYWGLRAGMRGRSVVWIISLVTYTGSLIVGSLVATG